jgi:hypothetical protein
VAERLTKLTGLIAFAYVLIMGFSYRGGTRHGREIAKRDRQKNGKPVFSSLAVSDGATVFWKDETLIQGGLRGIAAIAILSLYVAVMLLANIPSVERLSGIISTLLVYPNSMAALFVVQMTVVLGRRATARVWFFLVISVGAAVATWFIGKKVDSGTITLVEQLSIFTLQSLVTSHLVGVYEGIFRSDFERRYPAVEVVTADGNTLNDLRMLRAEEAGYHFVTPDGAECLVPKEQVRMVRAKTAEAKNS